VSTLNSTAVVRLHCNILFDIIKINKQCHIPPAIPPTAAVDIERSLVVPALQQYYYCYCYFFLYFV